MNASDATLKLPSILERLDVPSFNMNFADILSADAETPSDALALISVARHLLTEVIHSTPKAPPAKERLAPSRRARQTKVSRP